VGGLYRRLFDVFEERGRGEKQGRKFFFFLCLARPGKEEDPQCRSKWHRLGLFSLFFETVDETTPFYLKHTVSF